MNKRYALLLTAFLLLTAVHTYAHEKIQPSMSVSPNIFSPGQPVLFFACVNNSNPDSKSNIRAGDNFQISIGNNGGTVLSAGPVLVDSASLQSSDFTMASGATQNDVLIKYTGSTKKFAPGESVCAEISFQTFNGIGSFEMAFDPPASGTRYHPQQRSFQLGYIVDFPTGPAGVQGPTGPQGPAGPQGAVGPAAATGPQGPAGAQGIPGPVGPVGPTGAIGAQGPVGAQGVPGPAGAVGPQGATGPQGPQGTPGATGDTGPQGPPGTTGAQGPGGSQGSQGPQGIAGATGAQGSQGPAGPQGAGGPTGPQGPEGPIGPQGPRGPSATIIGGGTGSANLSASANRFVPAFYSNVSANETAVNQIMVIPGELSYLYVRLDNSPGGTTSYTFTVRKNGVDSTLSCTIIGSATSCMDIDPSHSLIFDAGDLISIKAVPSSPNPAARAMRWTAKFAPN